MKHDYNYWCELAFYLTPILGSLWGLLDPKFRKYGVAARCWIGWFIWATACLSAWAILRIGELWATRLRVLLEQL